ncbi:MAG: YHS domain-containing protein, partial [Xanthobacteraceae bacterium]
MAATTDPVCGMAVDPAQSRHRHDYRHHAYYFCSAGCRGKFAADPEKYLKPASTPAPLPQSDKDAIYTCPMHPEIR